MKDELWYGVGGLGSSSASAPPPPVLGVWSKTELVLKSGQHLRLKTILNATYIIYIMSKFKIVPAVYNHSFYFLSGVVKWMNK